MTLRQTSRVTGSFSTVTEVLRACAERNGDVEAFVETATAAPGTDDRPGDGRRRITFAQWDRAADGVAALFRELGVGRGDVVCLMLPSSIDYAVCYQAALRLGALTTGVNLRLGRPEQEHILARTRPKVTLVDDCAPGATGGSDLPGDAGRVVSRSELSEASERPAPVLPRTDSSDPVAIVWTSGSTGKPKGAVFDHAKLAAVADGTDVLCQWGDRRLSPLPFAHVAFMTRPWDEIVRAVTTVITPQPWSAAEAIRIMSEERVTVGQGVPTQWALMLRHESFCEADLSSLRVVGTGASRVPPELVRELRRRLGCPVVVRYTSTETSLGTGTRPDDPVEVVSTTVGKPVPGVELEVASAPDEVGVGRVRIRSAAVMRGYLGDVSKGELIDAELTATVLDADGWLTTGDLGFLGDDGNLRLVGRVNEMYIRGGYNVYPSEVEAVLGTHPAVSEVAVVGVSDAVLGEIGVAFVVAAPGQSAPDLPSLKSLVTSRLADYKAPDRLCVLEALPTTPMSKVDKKALVRRAEQLGPKAPAGSAGAAR